MPRGTGSPGSVTSTAAAGAPHRARAPRSARAAACAAARARRARGSAPGRALRAARPAGAPSSRRASVSALERPSASTRASSSSSAVVARSSCSRPCRSRLAASSIDIPASMQGRGRLPRGTTLLAPCRRHSLSARSTASRPAREVNFDGPSARGLSVTAPLPVADGARLLVSVGAGAAILPRVRRGAAAPGGEPYERLGPLYDRWCAGVDHDIPFYVLACEGAAGPIIELGAGSGRIAVELARHGHRVIALDASPAMLAQAGGAHSAWASTSCSRRSSATCATRPSCRRATA